MTNANSESELTLNCFCLGSRAQVTLIFSQKLHARTPPKRSLVFFPKGRSLSKNDHHAGGFQHTSYSSWKITEFFFNRRNCCEEELIALDDFLKALFAQRQDGYRSTEAKTQRAKKE